MNEMPLQPWVEVIQVNATSRAKCPRCHHIYNESPNRPSVGYAVVIEHNADFHPDYFTDRCMAENPSGLAYLAVRQGMKNQT